MPVNTQGQIVDEMGKPTGQTVDLNTGAVGGTQIPASQGTAPMNQIATPSAPSINVQNLQPGMKGSDVSGLQNFLIGQGYAIPAGATGYYGPQTQQALAQFQQKSGIDTAGNPGYFGPRTKSFIAQNTELANKFQSYFEQVKGSLAPENSADARMSLSELNKEQPDVQKEFQNILESMNPFEMQIYNQLATLNSSQQDKQSLTEFYASEFQKSGLPALNTEFADVKKIMDGTEDDIREEITRAGGFATESQVQAMTAARNKTLLRKASYLSDLINAKNDYLNNIVSLTKADREQADRNFDKKLNLNTQLFTMADTMKKNAQENYNSIVKSVGWGGLVSALKGDKAQMQRVEKLFGLAPGELQALAAYKKPLTAMEQAELENQQLQNKKLQQELRQGPTVNTTLQNFGTTNEPHYKLINSKTGAVITDYGSSVPENNNILAMASSQANIDNISNLLKDPNLNASVGPNTVARTSFFNMFTGGKSNFIAGVEQLRQQLTLDKLIAAKGSGATFGALSEGELSLLSSSASRLGTWAIKDGAGNVIGYNTDEKDFKAELDKINNFAKLDFILKGGTPSTVHVEQMADGTFWTKNSDGSFTQLK